MRWTPIILALVLSAGCTEEADKGAEENPLVEGKADSFFRPTEHGDLRFYVTNPATVSEDEKFHAWTFTLSDQASIDLKTEISNNLDTVMYLYHRENTGSSWGKYLKKNDDEKGKISSRIKLEAEAGEYRVVVKAFKSAMRGPFSLTGTCEGPGCTTPDDSCNDFQTIPSVTQMTDMCASDIAAVMFSDEISTASGSVALEEKCNLTGIELRAVDYYHEWWDGLVGFEEFFDSDGEGVEIYFQTVRHELGTVVDLDTGGDEDGITFIFDQNDTLLAMYQHNQSAVSEYFCTTGNPIEDPDEDCFWDALRALQHGDIETTEGDGILSELSGGGGVLELAAEAAVDQLGFDGNAQATYTLQDYYSSYDSEAAAALTLHVGEDTATFYFGTEYQTGLTLRLIEAGEKTQFVCE